MIEPILAGLEAAARRVARWTAPGRRGGDPTPAVVRASSEASRGEPRPGVTLPTGQPPAPTAADPARASADPARASADSARVSADPGALARCPEDATPLEPLAFPHQALSTCPTCRGVLVPIPLDGDVAADPSRFEDLPLEDAEAPEPKPLRYRACPVCQGPMARRNFERVSGVIVDRCPRHGTWFDAGELDAALTFVRAGGRRARLEFEAREWSWQRDQQALIASWAAEERLRSHPEAAMWSLLLDLSSDGGDGE